MREEWLTTDDIGHCEARGWWRGLPVGIVAGIFFGLAGAFGWSYAVPARVSATDGNNVNVVPVPVAPILQPMPVDPMKSQQGMK